jgi:hypothetical protein
MNSPRLARASLIGTLLQLAMVIAGHYLPLVKSNFMFGGLAISLLAGLVYAARGAEGWAGALSGGLVAGAVCALIGIAISCLLGDVPPVILLFGTLGSAVTGLLGAVLARLLAPARAASRPSTS